MKPTRPTPSTITGSRSSGAGIWQGRVAVVTGAASGVGRALSEALAVRDCRLALVDVNAEGLREVANRVQELGGVASTHIADVSDAERMKLLPEEILTEHGHIHILINNAGVTVAASFEDHSLEELRWLIGINLWGVVHGCHFFLPYLKREKDAKLVNISSSTAVMGFPGQSGYSASKGAIRSLSESLSAELHGSNVKLTSIYPGGIRTGLFEAARGANREMMAEMGNEPRVARMFLSPEKVAKTIIRAVERGRVRAPVGWDSYLVEWLWRLSPSLALYVSARAGVGNLSSEADIDRARGMRSVEVRRRFEAPPRAVWDVYTDHARWSEWAGTPGSRLVAKGQHDPNGVGAVRSFTGGVREQVLSFDPPRRMTYTVISGPFPIKDHEGEVVFEPDGDGTLVTWRCRFKSKIPGLGGLLERIVTSIFARGLEGLERHSFPPRATQGQR
ncbi:MAG: SDR family NAD(P)-dependent oxidoreductase [bacterium]|nr:SDR family NAD(P)-dependent oxidoreductase [bacterium]